MRNYWNNRVVPALCALENPQTRGDSTWTTIISVWLFVVFCAYAVIGLSILGWTLLG